MNLFSGVSEKLKHRTLQREAAKLFFGDLTIRPHPQDVARLIGKGLTERVVLSAARSKKLTVPIMELALREHTGVVPFVQQISDQLAQDHSGETFLFAARDAEMLFDDFAIRHAKQKARLMPASSSLMYSDSMMKNHRLASAFFEAYDLTAATASSDEKFAVVDTGIHGTIGIRVDKQFEAMHGVSLLEAGRLTIKLVSKVRTRLPSSQIMDFDKDSYFNPTVLPRVFKMFDVDRAIDEGHSTTIGLAVALQVMPHYRGVFEELQESGGTVRAIPDAQEWNGRKNIDYVGKSLWSMNESVVSPAAAAVFQYRTVNAALAAVGAAA
jgi:hypothetical protein